jgi:hypothetical protein
MRDITNCSTILSLALDLLGVSACLRLDDEIVLFCDEDASSSFHNTTWRQNLLKLLEDFRLPSGRGLPISQPKCLDQCILVSLRKFQSAIVATCFIAFLVLGIIIRQAYETDRKCSSRPATKDTGDTPGLGASKPLLVETSGGTPEGVAPTVMPPRTLGRTPACAAPESLLAKSPGEMAAAVVPQFRW